MDKFTDVRFSLSEWLMSFTWVKLLYPYQLYIASGAIAYQFIDEIIWRYTSFDLGIFSILDTISYWLFIISSLLLLIGPNLKYLPYVLWGYSLYILFPFTSFSLGTLVNAFIYGFLGFQVLRYSAMIEVTEDTSTSVSK